MSMLSRVKAIFKAKANAVLNEIENPEESLEFSLVEMREQLGKVKKSLVDVTTVKKELESQATDIRGKIKITEEQARLAVASNRDDLAKIALEKKQDLAEQEQRLTYQIGEVAEKIKSIKHNKEQLEDRINAMALKKDELIAMNRAADAQIAIKETITGISSSITDIGERVARAERKIKEKSARVSAIDELVELGAMGESEGKDDYEKELARIEREQAVRQELERLKQGGGIA